MTSRLPLLPSSLNPRRFPAAAPLQESPTTEPLIEIELQRELGGRLDSSQRLYSLSSTPERAQAISDVSAALAAHGEHALEPTFVAAPPAQPEGFGADVGSELGEFADFFTVKFAEG